MSNGRWAAACYGRKSPSGIAGSLSRPPHYAKINFGAGSIKKSSAFHRGMDDGLFGLFANAKRRRGDWGNACFSGMSAVGQAHARFAWFLSHFADGCRSSPRIFAIILGGTSIVTIDAANSVTLSIYGESWPAISRFLRMAAAPLCALAFPLRGG